MNRFTFRMRLLFTVVLGLSLYFSKLLPTAAAANIDPYADAVNDTTSGMILSPQAAIGAPDGSAATAGGQGVQHFVLDMGENEEGTDDLILHYLGVDVASAATVAFLDANHAVLATNQLPNLNTTPGRHRITLPYDSTLPPYRYVRFSVTMGLYSFDAVEATAHRPDSDGDGLPDIWEKHYWFNIHSPTGEDGADGDPDGDGCSNWEEYVAGTDPRDPNSCPGRIALRHRLFLPMAIN